MNVVVWVREIPDTRDLVGEVLGEGGEPRWDQWEGRFDPEDLNALEMALQLKDRLGSCVVTAVSSVGQRRLDVLRECLYRGADRVVRVLPPGDRPGVFVEARLVALAIRRLHPVDLLLTGIQLNELENAQRGAMLARLLDWPLVSYVEAVEGVEGGRIRLRRAIEGGLQRVEAELPAVVSVGVALLRDDPRAPRSAKAKLKLQHKKTEIPQWTAQDLGISDEPIPSRSKAIGYRAVEQRSFPSRRVDGYNEVELERMVRELMEQGLVR